MSIKLSINLVSKKRNNKWCNGGSYGVSMFNLIILRGSECIIISFQKVREKMDKRAITLLTTLELDNHHFW